MHWLRFRAQWRQQWTTLLALTLLVGIVGATVLATFAGARRTRSAVARTDAALRIPDGFALTATDSFAEIDAVLDSPVVEDGDRVAALAAFPNDGYLPMLATIDGKLGTELHYDRVVEGRRPRAGRPLEVALPQQAATQFGVGVGDRLSFHSLPTRHGICLYGDEEAAAANPDCEQIQRALSSEAIDLEALDGPEFDLEVVGITRGLEDIGAPAENLQPVYLPAAFYAEYGDDIASMAGVVARYRPGVTDQQFEAVLEQHLGLDALQDSTYSSSTIDALEATAGTLANGLLVFCGVAAIVGLVAIGQAIARQSAAGSRDRTLLVALGATRTQRFVEALAPLVPVAVVGSLVAVAGAWAASTIMPIGSVRAIEVERGFDFDVLVLGSGAVVLTMLVLAIGSFAVVWSDANRRRARAATLPPGAPVSVPAGLGVRWAVQRGLGTRVVPVRSAIAGVALGVAGIVAVAAFAEGLERLTNEPARTVWGWDLSINGERSGEEEPESPDDPEYLDAKAERILADPDVDGLGLGWLGLRVPIGGRSVYAYAQHIYEPGAGFVIVAGRAPAGPNEVALGAKTMRTGDLGIGDTVKVGDATMDVVGQAVFADVEDGYPLADGALLSAEGMEALGDTVNRESAHTSYAVRVRDGADRDAAVERLTALNRDEAPESPTLAPDIARLGQLDNLPGYLAVFLFVVALLAVAHALVITMRVRRQELAVVRALGATRRQSIRTLAWQATAIGVLGVVIGLPAGVILGRYVWATVARAYGVADDSPWPLFALVVVLPLTVLLANALAWWPGRRAARILPSDALRTE
jgi:hypothetical protein